MTFYSFYLFKRGQDFRLSPADNYRVLEMSGRLAITCANAPSVGLQKDVAFPHGNHRLDGYTHGSLEHHTISASPIVGYLRIFMHLAANTMTCELTDNAITLFLTETLYGVADVAQMIAGNGSRNALIKSLPGCAEQTVNLCRNLSYAEGVGRVTIETVELCATVNRNDITILQDCIFVRDSMHHTVIDRCADACGERPSVRIGEAFESRNGTMVTYELIGYLVQLESRHTRFDMFRQFAKRFTNKLVRLAH